MLLLLLLCKYFCCPCFVAQWEICGIHHYRLSCLNTHLSCVICFVNIAVYLSIQGTGFRCVFSVSGPSTQFPDPGELVLALGMCCLF